MGTGTFYGSGTGNVVTMIRIYLAHAGTLCSPSSSNAETKDEVKHLLELKVNKVIERPRFQQDWKSCYIVTLKDIANVQTAVRGGQSRNDLMTVVKKFQEEPGKICGNNSPPSLPFPMIMMTYRVQCISFSQLVFMPPPACSTCGHASIDTIRSLPIGGTIEVVKDVEDNLLGIFYQDSDMKNTFSSFPEILFVDATYKENDLRLPLYVLLIEDGNGLSEIIAIWLVADESRTTTESMTDIFVKHNPGSKDIKVIMADKDFNERQVFADAFPQAGK